MTILDKIIARKRLEVTECKQKVSIASLEASDYFTKTTVSLKQALFSDTNTGIIAEFKRKSPSKGIINDQVRVEDVTAGYVSAGAAGLSVLTDTEFFMGTQADLLVARKTNPSTPILRKDFMIDEYQLLEAKAWGADVILLIAANLSVLEVKSLSHFAQNLGLEVLLEVHNQEELDSHLCDTVDIVGVNNRNLKNFAEQNVNASLELADQIPSAFVKISESCISRPETIQLLRGVGYRGFLIGENFMKTSDPSHAIASFVAQLHQPAV
ncbi:MAG: indole-3-glycerol phosphate synthase TrpC [Spirosomataceae bacterium]